MQGGFGSLLSFDVKRGRAEALAVAGKLQLIISATSLGGVEILIEHRHSVEPPETRIFENLLRLAVGVKALEDLWSDLKSALDSVIPVCQTGPQRLRLFNQTKISRNVEPSLKH